MPLPYEGSGARLGRQPASVLDAARHVVADLDVGRIASVLLALVALLAALSGIAATGAELRPVDVTLPWNVPAALTGALLVATAGLAMAAHRAMPGDRSAAATAIPLGAAVLVVLSVDAVAQVHERLGAAAAGLRLLVAGLALLALARALVPTLRRRGAAVAAGGLGLWLGALTVAGVRLLVGTREEGARLGEELLELSGAALLAVGLLAAAQPALRATAEAAPTSRRALDLATALSFKRVTTVLGLGIAVLGLLGAFQFGVVHLAVLDLDSELTLPAYFSAFLLLLAALAAVVRAEVGDGGALAWRLLGAFFLFMSVDELTGLHEGLGAAMGLYWQALYGPIVLVGGVTWLLALRRMRTQPLPAGLFGLGALAFVAAQWLDRLQWGDNTGVIRHAWTTVPEEVLEMGGAALWAVAILLSLQLVVARRRPARTSAAGRPRHALSWAGENLALERDPQPGRS